jgi:hypothetical protein
MVHCAFSCDGFLGLGLILFSLFMFKRFCVHVWMFWFNFSSVVIIRVTYDVIFCVVNAQIGLKEMLRSRG